MVVALIKSRRHCVVSHFNFLCIDNLGLITYFSDKPFIKFQVILFSSGRLSVEIENMLTLYVVNRLYVF